MNAPALVSACPKPSLWRDRPEDPLEDIRPVPIVYRQDWRTAPSDQEWTFDPSNDSSASRLGDVEGLALPPHPTKPPADHKVSTANAPAAGAGHAGFGLSAQDLCAPRPKCRCSSHRRALLCDFFFESLDRPLIILNGTRLWSKPSSHALVISRHSSLIHKPSKELGYPL